MREFRIEIARAKRAATKALEALCREILSLPPNKRTRKLGDNCCVVRFSDLGKNWSVEHHIFELQYFEIVQALQAAGPFRAVKRLREIIRNGYVRLGGSASKINLHVDVVEHLHGVIGAPAFSRNVRKQHNAGNRAKAGSRTAT